MVQPLPRLWMQVRRNVGEKIAMATELNLPVSEMVCLPKTRADDSGILVSSRGNLEQQQLTAEA
jgi:hypothetical protein